MNTTDNMKTDNTDTPLEIIRRAQATIEGEKTKLMEERKTLWAKIQEIDQILGTPVAAPRARKAKAQPAVGGTRIKGEPRESSAKGKLLALIRSAGKAVTTQEMKDKIKKFNAVYVSQLGKAGLIKQVKRGVWEAA